MIPLHTRVLADGLHFPEGPRWRDGKLWFSDMHSRRVMTVDADGRLETVVNVPGSPSGLGWLPDGSLLIVSMTDRRLLRLDETGLTQVADLAGLATYHCNDMVVDGSGRAYIGNFGFDLARGQAPTPAEIIMVTPEGEAVVVAEDLLFPNGMVIGPQDNTLIVAETFGHRLTAFDIRPDGFLSNRRVWAPMDGYFPDGICMDAGEGVWVASPDSHAGVLRVTEGGVITDRVAVASNAYACMLGGDDRRTLFVLTSGHFNPAKNRAEGRIEVVAVQTPGVGRP